MAPLSLAMFKALDDDVSRSPQTYKTTFILSERRAGAGACTFGPPKSGVIKLEKDDCIFFGDEGKKKGNVLLNACKVLMRD